jgi:hypothetical protein
MLFMFIFYHNLSLVFGQILYFESYQTERMATCVMLTICLIIESAIVPLLARANFSEYGFNLFGLTHGRNTDFGSIWYSDYGP